MKIFEQNPNTTSVIKQGSTIEGKKKKPPCIFKVAVSPAEYILLTEKFKFKKVPKRLYIYLDTSDSSKDAELFRNRIRLRIKIKDSKYFLELKKRGDSKAEVSDSVSIKDFQQILSGTLPDGNVKNELIELGTFVPVKPVDTVKSKHQKVKFHDGYLVLEKTTTNHNKETDFQLEFRSEKPFSEEEVRHLITEELGISNISKDRTKLQKFWKDR